MHQPMVGRSRLLPPSTRPVPRYADPAAHADGRTLPRQQRARADVSVLMLAAGGAPPPYLPEGPSRGQDHTGPSGGAGGLRREWQPVASIDNTRSAQATLEQIMNRLQNGDVRSVEAVMTPRLIDNERAQGGWLEHRSESPTGTSPGQTNRRLKLARSGPTRRRWT